MDDGHAPEFGIFPTPSAEQPDAVVALVEPLARLGFHAGQV